MNKTFLFILFSLLSVIVAVLGGIWAFVRYLTQRKKGRILSTVQFLTLWVFFACALFFLPIYYCYYFQSGFEGIEKIFSNDCVKPVFLSIHNAFRLFILDGDFDIVVKALAGEGKSLQLWCSAYAMALYIIAPILTFGNVLSLFENIKDSFRYRITKRKNLYIFSELNARSLALATDIYKRAKNKDDTEIKSARIVFCSVFERDEEDNAAMLMEARTLHALCLKTDITNVHILSKWKTVELFLMGDNEADNVSKGAKITDFLNQKNKKHKLKHSIKVFVFNQSEGAGHVIDSLQYDNLLCVLPESLWHRLKNSFDDLCGFVKRLCGFENKEKTEAQLEKLPKDNERPEYLFKLRRVDEKQQLVWNTLPKMNIFDLAAKNAGNLYVLIAGMGSYGMEFFRTILWFAQFEGHKLYITIADKRTEEQIKSMLNRQCPDILKTQKTDCLGEAHYDIEIIGNVDVSQSDLANILLREDTGFRDRECLLKRRLAKTNLAIVALGDDNQNIETAVHLRTIFDRVHQFKAYKEMPESEEVVQIYSIVYDELISHNLHTGCEDTDSEFLKNHANIPYHIHFIGSMTEQFTYQNVHNAVLEYNAFINHHLGWVNVDAKIYEEWEKTDPKLLEKFFMNKNGELQKPSRSESDRIKEQKKYENYEYYRLSSISKELYWQATRGNGGEYPGNADILRAIECKNKTEQGETLQSCTCENCSRKKRSEHMRWNAYIRSYGFSYHQNRADRALLHNNLCVWDKLPENEKWKD